MGNPEDIIQQLRDKFGNSNDKSRQAVIDAHGGMEKMAEMAMLWAGGAPIFGEITTMIQAYATAMELGVRIGWTIGKPDA